MLNEGKQLEGTSYCLAPVLLRANDRGKLLKAALRFAKTLLQNDRMRDQGHAEKRIFSNRQN